MQSIIINLTYGLPMVYSAITNVVRYKYCYCSKMISVTFLYEDSKVPINNQSFYDFNELHIPFVQL